MKPLLRALGCVAIVALLIAMAYRVYTRGPMAEGVLETPRGESRGEPLGNYKRSTW